MLEIAKQSGLMYVGLGAFWIVVNVVVWALERAFSSRVDARRVEEESAPAGEARRGAFHTFTRGLAALSVMNAIMIVAFPAKDLGPLSAARYAAELIAALVAFDFLFYLAHRALHHRWLWKAHELHHRYRFVSVWVRNADSISQVLVIGIAALPMQLIPMHLETKITFVLLSTACNVLQHLGYEVFPRWRWIGNVFVTPTHHSLHHTEVDCNYGYFFVVWDRVFRSFHPRTMPKFLGERSDASSGAVDVAAAE
jgi:sterol desaturase/sphingolipid hydroxylase (fatty acid hydroxylase superfamily)